MGAIPNGWTHSLFCLLHETIIYFFCFGLRAATHIQKKEFLWF